MYTDHYGLTDRPFQLTPDARFWFDSRSHRKAMAYLGYEPGSLPETERAKARASSSSPAMSARASRRSSRT